jgi:hypothetical protein
MQAVLSSTTITGAIMIVLKNALSSSSHCGTSRVDERNHQLKYAFTRLVGHVLQVNISKASDIDIIVSFFLIGSIKIFE